MQRVLGIDPGTHRVGWGLIEGTPSKQVALDHGCIEAKSGVDSSVYLPAIATEVEHIISQYQPDFLGLETLLFQKNAKTAISVAEARGVILLTAARHHLPVVEMAPNTIKLAVAGNGSSGKLEVERMVGLLLGVNTKKLLDDTTDALAVAIAAMVTRK